MTLGLGARLAALRIGVLVVALVALAGCAGGRASTSDADRSDHPTSSTAPSRGGTTGSSPSPKCSDLDGGTGVVQTFCTGPGTATFVVGGRERSVTGGRCEVLGGEWIFEAGTMISSEYEGTLPDYVNVDVPAKDGTVATNTISAYITTGGKAYTIRKAQGTHHANETLLIGSTLEGNEPVTLRVTC